jgi:hypothetical protein
MDKRWLVTSLALSGAMNCACASTTNVQPTIATTLAPTTINSGAGAISILTYGEFRNAHLTALCDCTLEYDPITKCVSLMYPHGERVVPVWPYGFTAFGSPVTVLDADGEVFAIEGQRTKIGGGEEPFVRSFGDGTTIIGDNNCGDMMAWYI